MVDLPQIVRPIFMVSECLWLRPEGERSEKKKKLKEPYSRNTGQLFTRKTGLLSRSLSLGRHRVPRPHPRADRVWPDAHVTERISQQPLRRRSRKELEFEVVRPEGISPKTSLHDINPLLMGTAPRCAPRTYTWRTNITA